MVLSSRRTAYIFCLNICIKCTSDGFRASSSNSWIVSEKKFSTLELLKFTRFAYWMLVEGKQKRRQTQISVDVYPPTPGKVWDRCLLLEYGNGMINTPEGHKVNVEYAPLGKTIFTAHQSQNLDQDELSVQSSSLIIWQWNDRHSQARLRSEGYKVNVEYTPLGKKLYSQCIKVKTRWVERGKFFSENMAMEW